MAKVSKDHIDKFFDYSVDLDNRTIYLGSIEYSDDEDETGVDFKMAEKFIKALYLLEKAAPSNDKPINIIMNNPGGNVIDGMAIYDAIKNCKNHVTITVFGQACSMGCIILQAADYRVLAPHAVVMFHEGTDSYAQNHPEIIKRWINFNEKYYKLINKIVIDRIKQKKPEFKDKKFEELNLFDTILTAQEAIDMGLADEVLDGHE